MRCSWRKSPLWPASREGEDLTGFRSSDLAIGSPAFGGKTIFAKNDRYFFDRNYGENPAGAHSELDFVRSRCLVVLLNIPPGIGSLKDERNRHIIHVSDARARRPGGTADF
jgi:hypothetical protein